MADAEATPEATEEKKKSPIKSIGLIAVLLIAEAVGIVGAIKVLGSDSEVGATPIEADPEQAAGEKINEILVLETKLHNAQSGSTYVYSTEVYVQVKQKHADRVNGELEQFSNEIKADISAIWRTADPQHFKEPRLETLTRKVTALLRDRFGSDEDGGGSIVEKCVIVMGTGFRVDI